MGHVVPLPSPPKRVRRSGSLSLTSHPDGVDGRCLNASLGSHLACPCALREEGVCAADLHAQSDGAGYTVLSVALQLVPSLIQQTQMDLMRMSLCETPVRGVQDAHKLHMAACFHLSNFGDSKDWTKEKSVFHNTG